MDMQTNFLQITYKPEITNGKSIHISSNALPSKASNYEPAGLSFHLAALKLSGYNNKEDKDTDTDDQSVKSDDRDQTYIPSSEPYTKNKKKGNDKDDSKQQDHYALLGLGHLRFLATEDQIKKCYRETALRYHPDKQASLLLSEVTEEAKQKKKDEIENHFKAVQEAYEVLTDPMKRRLYDSTDEFDDAIPTTCGPNDFFKVFGPVFMRNGKWSVTQPVPSLGDEGTPLKEVDGFYDFWYSFRSWREFPHADEHDIEEAESRDEKRWMERQNAKLREKARKEEYSRVRSLVDNAYRKDPRIRGRKEAEKAEKLRKKEAKLMVKRKQEEEAARAAEEEKHRKEEEEKKAAEAAAIQKKKKEKEKKLLRKERSRLRALCSNSGVSVDDVESLCMSLDMENIKCLCDNLEGIEDDSKIKELKLALGKGNTYTSKSSNSNLNSNSNGDTNGNINGEEETWSDVQEKELFEALKTFTTKDGKCWERIAASVPGKTVDQCKMKLESMKENYRGKKEI